MVQRLGKLRAAAGAGLLLFSLCAIAQPVQAAPAARWPTQMIQTFFDSCLAVPGNMSDDVALATHRTFQYEDQPPSESDRLNGVTQLGTIIIVQAYRYPKDSAWRMGRFLFTFNRLNGVSQITYLPMFTEGTYNAAWDMVSLGDGWPCNSRG